MSETADNLVLRLLQEICGKLEGHDYAFDSLNLKVTEIERHMEDVKESVICALGLSAHANVAYETTGQRLDRLTEKVARLETRLGVLEETK